jgi:hypothetical protein
MLIREEAVAVAPQFPNGREAPPSTSMKVAGFCWAKTDADIHRAVRNKTILLEFMTISFCIV